MALSALRQRERQHLKLSLHALLVEAPGLKLVVDTCVGNDQTILVIGTHFAAPTAGHAVRDGAAFKFAV